jgi:tetratricopeptide (TPR) repeat protein
LGFERSNDYPLLNEWYSRYRHSAAIAKDVPISQKLVAVVCESWDCEEAKAADYWGRNFSRLLRESVDPLSDFLKADDIFLDCEASQLQIISDFGERALRHDQGQSIVRTLTLACDLLQLNSLRFLLAWIYLNLNQLQDCVDQCEAIEDFSAAAYTLKGQAELEMGSVDAAIETLAIAVKLDANEVLGWFQLTKALYAQGKYQAAWNAAAQCSRLATTSGEVAYIKGLLATLKGSIKWADEAWPQMVEHLPVQKGNSHFVSTLLTLAIQRNDMLGFKMVVKQLDADDLVADRDFMSKLAPILKELGTRHQFVEAKMLLEKLT